MKRTFAWMLAAALLLGAGATSTAQNPRPERPLPSNGQPNGRPNRPPLPEPPESDLRPPRHPDERPPRPGRKGDRRRVAHYVTDTWNVYYRGRKVEGAAVSSFRELAPGYGRDAWSVFFDGVKIEGASASSFEYLGEGYGRDAWNTYYFGRRADERPRRSR